MDSHNYTIKYNVNGGTGVTDGSYDYESAAITLPTPTKAGYTFAGWYTNTELIGTEVTSILTHSTGNKEFWAKWSAPVLVSTVKLNKNKTTLSVNSTEELTVIITPSYATNKNVSWSSSNTAIATIVNGVITAKAVGTATITVTTEDGNKTATCTVTVQTETIAVTGISLNKTTTTLSVNATELLTASITPSNASNKNLTWSSSNMAVATVVDGVITAKAVGTTTITATTNDGNKTATCTVTVQTETIAVTGVSLNKTITRLSVNATEQLTASIVPSNATNKNVSWSSSNTAVAKVVDGLIVAISPGTASILVTTDDRNKTSICTVTVQTETIAVTDISLNKTTTTLSVNSTEQLTASIAPSNATNKTVFWSSNKPAVATVINGLLTAIAQGTAIITVGTEDGNKTATCTVTVQTGSIAVTGISLNRTTTTLSVNSTEQLTATIAPSNATNKTLTWNSSNVAIATVVNGLTTAVSQGTATITVVSKDGNYSATCLVTVQTAAIAVTGVSLNKTTTSLPLNATEQLTATIAPSNATDKIVSWSSSNPAIATVVNGLVKAVSQGTANITVTTRDGNFSATCPVRVRPAQTDSYLVRLSAVGKDIDVTEENLEYIADCGETEVSLDIEVSQFAFYTVDNVAYSGQSIPLTGDVTTVIIKVAAEAGGTEKIYTLKMTKAVENNKLYFQRWKDVLTINNNPANNGGHTIEDVRWYKQDGEFIGTGSSIPIQGSASNYYAEIKIADAWHRVCGTTETKGITIYPNPVPRGETAKVKITDDFVGGYLNIFGITGSLVKSNVPLPATTGSIDVQDLPTGIYLFRLISKSGNSETIKIVIE